MRFCLSFIFATTLAVLGACTPGGIPKHKTPVPAHLVSAMESEDMDPRAPVLMRLYKSESKLEVWKKTRSGPYALLTSYNVCRWSGDLGPKVKEGDRQSPEGFYTITPGRMNPNSSYYLSFDTGFPNAYDRAHGWFGNNLMVHGDCSSRGCYAMTNEQVEEIYALARDAFDGGQKGFQLQLLPFRMTAENLYKYRRNPHLEFWKNLKEGSDHFEVTGNEPVVGVCSYRYVFDETPFTAGAVFSPTSPCPPAAVSSSIQNALAGRASQEASFMARLGDKNEKKGSLLSSLVGGDNPESAYDSREKILSSLPASSPEALSLLPGVEGGASPQLRQIAGLNALPQMPGRVTENVAPYYAPKDEPKEAASVAKISTQKPAEPLVRAKPDSSMLRGTQ